MNPLTVTIRYLLSAVLRGFKAWVCDCCIEQCSVNIDGGMYFVFAGIQAAPQGGPILVGITLRVFLYI